jgi:hypothetical protein
MRLRIGVALALIVVAAAALLAGPWRHGFRLSDLLTGGTPLLPDGTRAVGGSADLSGNATLGAGQRPATLHLACDPGGSGLSAVLTVPRLAEPSPFDVAGLSGTEGAAPLTAILVSNAAGVRSVRMPAQGAAGTGPEAGFTLTVTGARRGEDPLRGITLALVQPGTKLTWTQASPRAGDPALAATFAVAEADAATLKTALGGCLAAPF